MRSVKHVYLRQDLSDKNEEWISDAIGAMSLSDYREKLAALVKEKTGRAMQRKDKTNAQGKKVNGCSPLREGVVVVSESTTLEHLLDFCERCRQRFGITPLHIFIHRDEGYWSSVDSEWKPNLHAHIVWDWIDHDTGKTLKLNNRAMSQMQTILAECLGMERGMAKSLTGATHLERNDFILAKQEEAKAYNQAVIASQQREIREKEAIKAEKKDEADKEAVSFLGTKVQSWVGMGELHELRKENKEMKETFDKRVKAEVQRQTKPLINEANRLRKEIAEKDNELLDEKAISQAIAERLDHAEKGIEWRNSALAIAGRFLCEAWELFSNAVKKLIAFAKENARMYFYREALDAEDAKAVRNVMDAVSKDPLERRAIGNMLVMAASKQDEAVAQQEHILYREIESIANGGYDLHIRQSCSYRF